MDLTWHDLGAADLTVAELYDVLALRNRVFVVEQECAYQDLDGRDLEPGTRHLWIGAPAPVAYLRLLDDGGVARIGRVLVDREHRGAGLAERLVRRALELVGDQESRLDAQSYLQGWYARFGFRPAGPEFVEDGIPHVPMTRPGAGG